jgi:hypothetical protein
LLLPNTVEQLTLYQDSTMFQPTTSAPQAHADADTPYTFALPAQHAIITALRRYRRHRWPCAIIQHALVTAVTAGLVETLKVGPFTVFMVMPPLLKIPKGYLDALLADKKRSSPPCSLPSYERNDGH